MNASNRAADFGILVLRLVAGLVLFYYGCQKLLGAFGGPGFQATVQGFQSSKGIPPVFAILAIIAEFFGSLGVMLGLFTRVAAFGCFVTMAVAAFTHFQELTTIVASEQVRAPLAQVQTPLLLAACFLAIMMIGAGPWSLDAKFFGKKGRK